MRDCEDRTGSGPLPWLERHILAPMHSRNGRKFLIVSAVCLILSICILGNRDNILRPYLLLEELVVPLLCVAISSLCAAFFEGRRDPNGESPGEDTPLREQSGLLPWLELHVFSRLRGRTGRKFLLLGIELLALLCIIGISAEANAQPYEGFFRAAAPLCAIAFTALSAAFQQMEKPFSSLRSQAIWFFTALVFFLLVVGIGLWSVILYYLLRYPGVPL